MKRYFYFRDVADEADDDDNSASIMVPVDNITGIQPNSTTSLYIYHDNVKGEQKNDYISLTVTRGKLKEVTRALVQAMNAGPHHGGVTVVADATTTTNGATSLQGDNVSVPERFLHRDITGVSIVAY